MKIRYVSSVEKLPIEVNLDKVNMLYVIGPEKWLNPLASEELYKKQGVIKEQKFVKINLRGNEEVVRLIKILDKKPFREKVGNLITKIFDLEEKKKSLGINSIKLNIRDAVTLNPEELLRNYCRRYELIKV